MKHIIRMRWLTNCYRCRSHFARNFWSLLIIKVDILVLITWSSKSLLIVFTIQSRTIITFWAVVQSLIKTRLSGIHFGATTNHISLKYRCLIKKINQIRIVYLVTSWSAHIISRDIFEKCCDGFFFCFFFAAGITVLWALAAALVPPMQKGNETARSLHIAFNTVNLLLFAWQIPTGWEIVVKVFEFTKFPWTIRWKGRGLVSTYVYTNSNYLVTFPSVELDTTGFWALLLIGMDSLEGFGN